MINNAGSIFQDERSFPDIIPGLTDIKLTVEEVSDDMGVWGAFDILLVDATALPDDLLSIIGQPV